MEATGIRQKEGGTQGNSPQFELFVRRDDSNTVGPTVIGCNYVVAADGAGSLVRAAAALEVSGRRALGHLVNVHFRCKELGRLLRARGQRPGMLSFVYNEARYVGDDADEKSV